MGDSSSLSIPTHSPCFQDAVPGGLSQHQLHVKSSRVHETAKSSQSRTWRAYVFLPDVSSSHLFSSLAPLCLAAHLCLGKNMGHPPRRSPLAPECHFHCRAVEESRGGTRPLRVWSASRKHQRGQGTFVPLGLVQVWVTPADIQSKENSPLKRELFVQLLLDPCFYSLLRAAWKI